MNLYHVIYTRFTDQDASQWIHDGARVKQESTQVIANNVAHAVYLAQIKIGDCWQSLLDCYLLQEGQ